MPLTTVVFRRRLAVLALSSAVAGLVVGVVLPGPAGAADVAAASVPATHRSILVVSPALFRAGSPSPFGAVPRATATSAVRAIGADPLSPHQSPAPALPAATAAYVPTRPLPAHSGTGRRIVYAETTAHLWVVGADGTVLRDYPVTGRVGRPQPSVYHVYSKSPVATNPGEKLRFEFMVRFAVGRTGARIGFHTIPRSFDGVPIESVRQLGRAIGAGGCVRQTRADAQWLFGWARLGDTVVVLR